MTEQERQEILKTVKVYQKTQEVTGPDLDVRTSSPEFEKEFDWLLNFQELKSK